MVSTCCVFACRERYTKGGSITFHSFPKDEKKRKLWELQIQRENFKPTKHSKVCSKHFTKDCFDTLKSGGSWLKPNALPTIFDFPNHILSKKSTCKSPKGRILEDNHRLQPSCQNKPGTVRRSRNTCKTSIPMANVKGFKIGKRCRYVGDFNEGDMLNPFKAQRVFSIAKEQTELQRNKIKLLTKKKRHLLNSVSLLRMMLRDLKKSLKISSASSILQENKQMNSKETTSSVTVSKLKPVVIYVKACSEPDDKSSVSTVDMPLQSPVNMSLPVPKRSYFDAKNPFEFRKQLRVVLEKHCFHKDDINIPVKMQKTNKKCQTNSST